MSRLDDFLPNDRRLTVSFHAVEQMRERFSEDVDGLGLAQVSALIVRQVEQAVAKKQVFDVKPRGFRLYGEDGKLPPWQRFVRHDSDRGWIVATDDPASVVVVTTLLRRSTVPRW